MRINRKQFISDLQVASNALGASGFILAFQCFHIRENVIFATDGATSIKRTLPYDTNINCSIFGMPFLTTLQNIKDEEILLEQEKDKLILETKKIEGEFSIIGEAKGIKIPQYSHKDSCAVPLVKSFVNALGECKFSVSRDETQGCLCGVLADKNFTYSTDRFQIMKHVIKDDCTCSGLIFPSKLIEILEKLCVEESTIQVTKEEDGDSKVIVYIDKDTVLEGCTLSGQFPPVAQQFMKFDDLYPIEFDKNVVKEVIDRHITFQKGVLDIDRSTTIELVKDVAYFQTMDPNVGNLVEEVSLTKSFDDKVVFKINPVFLKLAVVAGSTLFFSPSHELIQICSEDFEFLAKIR